MPITSNLIQLIFKCVCKYTLIQDVINLTGYDHINEQTKRFLGIR